MTVALILVASLSLATMALCVYLLPRGNHSLKKGSPTPTTTPGVDTSVVMTTMREMTESWMKETRELVTQLVLGREQPRPTGERETLPTSSENPNPFDYDSTPLSPGIEAVLARELEEDRLSALRRERLDLQERLAQVQTEQRRMQERTEEEEETGFSPTRVFDVLRAGDSQEP
jgi:hypothetical protein